MLTRYGSIDDIPLDADAWDVQIRGAGALAAGLAERMHDALLYRQLATLRLDVPLSETDPDQLRWNGVRQPDFAEFCQSLGLESLLNRLPEPQST